MSPLYVEQVFDIIQAINRQGTTIFMVEQNAAMALQSTHRAYVLRTGVVVLSGTAEELRQNEGILQGAGCLRCNPRPVRRLCVQCGDEGREWPIGSTPKQKEVLSFFENERCAVLANKQSGARRTRQKDGCAAEQVLGRPEPHDGSTRGHMKPALTGEAPNPSNNRKIWFA